MFRDETEKTKSKTLKKAEIQISNPTDRHLSSADPGTSSPGRQFATQHELACSPKQSPIPPSIHQSTHYVAIHFLLGNYICESHFHYLPSLYTTDQTKALLEPIVTALGLASLSLQTSRPELQKQAEKLYVEAIAHTNTALECKDLARNDDVLAAILLLSLFETLNLRANVGVDAWNTHMQGALALVALRGPTQFHSKFGLELFKQIAASIRVFCIQRCIRIPQKLRALTKLAQSYSHRNDISFEYPRIVEAFTDLRADMKEGFLTEPDEVIARARDVLQTVQDLHTNLLPDLLYDTAFVQKPCAEIHRNYYYRFKDHHVAQMWNTTWMGKLHLNTIIIEQLLKALAMPTKSLGPRSELVCMIMESEREIIESAENICASVPQFFPAQRSSEQPTTRSTHAVAPGYFLIWPLFTAGSSSLIHSSTKAYIVDRLEYIAADLKLPQASRAAQMLIQDHRDENWMHICHVF